MAKGRYWMQRGWLDHPAFSLSPYSQRDAWVWLIENAAWKARAYKINGGTINLRRGQVVVSTRFLAKKWGWSKSSASRFLAKLIQFKMVTADIVVPSWPGTSSGTSSGTPELPNLGTAKQGSLGTPCRVLTLSNYARFQGETPKGGTPETARLGTSYFGGRGTPSGTPSGTKHKKELEEGYIPKKGIYPLSDQDFPKFSDLPRINGRVVYPQPFEDWWALYPPCPNNSKKAAYEKFRAAIKNGTALDALTQGVQKYAAYIEATTGLVCHAATWIGQERWENDFTIRDTRHPTAVGNRQQPTGIVAAGARAAARLRGYGGDR